MKNHTMKQSTRKTAWILFLTALVLVSFASFAFAAENWLMFRGNPQRTGTMAPVAAIPGSRLDS